MKMMETSTKIMVELVAMAWSSSKGERISVFCAPVGVKFEVIATELITLAATLPATRARPGGPPSLEVGDEVGEVAESHDMCDAEDSDVCDTERNFRSMPRTLWSNRICLSRSDRGNSRFKADTLL